MCHAVLWQLLPRARTSTDSDSSGVNHRPDRRSGELRAPTSTDTAPSHGPQHTAIGHGTEDLKERPCVACGAVAAAPFQSKWCSQRQCSGCGFDAGRPGIASTDSDSSAVNHRPDCRSSGVNHRPDCRPCEHRHRRTSCPLTTGTAHRQRPWHRRPYGLSCVPCGQPVAMQFV